MAGGKMFEKCPEEVQKIILPMIQQAEIQQVTKSYDPPTYQMKLEGFNISVKV